MVDNDTVPYVIGIVLALLTAAFARVAGFDRDRAFYPTVLIVIASYYVLFAAMAESRQAVIVEAIVLILFTVLAVAGFKFKFWIVAAGLAAHGVFDFVHAAIIANPGVPSWWPAFCLAFDVGLGGMLLLRPRRP